MIQLIGLRSFKDDAGKEKKFDAFFDKGWRAESVQDLFLNIEERIKQIPEEMRWNMFYTVANCTDKKREFESMDVLPFDIDNLDVERIPEYVKLFCETLGVKEDQTGVVFSGNGLQLFIGLQVPIVDKSFFTTHREHYRALVSQLDQAMAKAGLPGDADPAVFDARRILRLPRTMNRKPGKPEREAKLLQANIIPTTFDITQASGIPQVGKDEQVDPDYFTKYPKTDNGAILKGCNFLKYTAANPVEPDEPQLYAALSILARMEDGKNLTHQMFEPRLGKRAHGGTREDLDMKLAQASQASGPRTCKSINNLWEGCKTCPNNGKVTSPIMLISPDTIKTESTGFHDMVFDPETMKMKRGKPNYEDLRKFFEKGNPYVSQGRVCYTFNGKFYQEMDRERLENFAQKHFNPTADSRMAEEFRKLVHRTNLVTSDFWEGTTNRRVNFQNGVLSLDTMTMQPHAKEFGFRYCLPYNYDPLATCPTFKRFLGDVTCGSESLQAILLEFMGYAISGDECLAQKALLLSGIGANGKSTFVHTLTAMAGKDNYQNVFYTKLSEDYYKIKLQGTLFNISEETPARGAKDSSEFKNMVTGGMVMARGPYQAPVRFKMKAKLIFLANEAPATHDTTDGFFRRFLVVPFNAKFTKENGLKDAYMEEKLLTELPGIFNLVIQAYARLVEADYEFSGSAESEAELESYRENVDPVLSWFREWVTIKEVTAREHTTVANLHASYTEYFEKFGFQRSMMKDVRWFGRQLKHLIPDYVARTHGGKPTWIDGKAQRVIQGIKIPDLAPNPYGV